MVVTREKRWRWLMRNEGNQTYYLWSEIEKHTLITDCWIVADDWVYDATKFLRLHPAGPRSIFNKAGTDCSRDFGFHSASAKQMWNVYRIGRVKDSRRKTECIIM